MGPATAHGVGLLTEMYVIYMCVGPLAVAGEAVTDAKADGRKARKYVRIWKQRHLSIIQT